MYVCPRPMPQPYKKKLSLQQPLLYGVQVPTGAVERASQLLHAELDIS